MPANKRLRIGQFFLLWASTAKDGSQAVAQEWVETPQGHRCCFWVGCTHAVYKYVSSDGDTVQTQQQMIHHHHHRPHRPSTMSLNWPALFPRCFFIYVAGTHIMSKPGSFTKIADVMCTLLFWRQRDKLQIGAIWPQRLVGVSTFKNFKMDSDEHDSHWLEFFSLESRRSIQL